MKTTTTTTTTVVTEDLGWLFEAVQVTEEGLSTKLAVSVELNGYVPKYVDVDGVLTPCELTEETASIYGANFRGIDGAELLFTTFSIDADYQSVTFYLEIRAEDDIALDCVEFNVEYCVENRIFIVEENYGKVFPFEVTNLEITRF